MTKGRDEISIADVERRILRAVRTLKCVRDRDKAFLSAGSRSSMPAYKVEWSDLVARAELQEPEPGLAAPFFPTRADIGDYLTALDWVAGLARLPSKRAPRAKRRVTSEFPSATDQLILFLIAFEFSFAAVGRKINKNEFEVKRRYRAILDDCWRIANGYVALQSFRQGRCGNREIMPVEG